VQFTKFGQTGLTVSRMILGTGTFGKQTDEKEAHPRREKDALQASLCLGHSYSGVIGRMVSSGRKIQKPVGVKKHGRVWTPAMRAADSKRAKARWAKITKA